MELGHLPMTSNVMQGMSGNIDSSIGVVVATKSLQLLRPFKVVITMLSDLVMASANSQTPNHGGVHVYKKLRGKIQPAV